MFIVADIISGFYFMVLRFVHVFGKRLKVPVGNEEGSRLELCLGKHRNGTLSRLQVLSKWNLVVLSQR